MRRSHASTSSGVRLYRSPSTTPSFPVERKYRKFGGRSPEYPVYMSPPRQVIDPAEKTSGVPFRTRPSWQMKHRQPSGGGTWVADADAARYSNVIGSSPPEKCFCQREVN